MSMLYGGMLNDDSLSFKTKPWMKPHCQVIYFLSANRKDHIRMMWRWPSRICEDWVYSFIKISQNTKLGKPTSSYSKWFSIAIDALAYWWKDYFLTILWHKETLKSPILQTVEHQLRCTTLYLPHIYSNSHTNSTSRTNRKKFWKLRHKNNIKK